MDTHLKWLSSLVPLLLCAGIAGWLPRVSPLDGGGPQLSAAGQGGASLAIPPPAGAPRDEFAGPFPSWVNVRTQHGAIGDGLADDSAALQRAFDEVRAAGRSPVVYLPNGTYRITRTLALNYEIGVTVVGEDPDRTRLVWDGPPGGTMLGVHGIAYSRISRLTFDGRGNASIAVEQAWDNGRGNFDTGNEYADDRFVDVEYGIRGGYAGYGFAETSILRARFIRNRVAAVSLGNFNALDIWVWHSLFEDCGTGLTNQPGAGNFRVYSSVFRRSTVADIAMQNTGGFTARDNYSVGSKAFWVAAAPMNHPATIDIQGNTIIDTQSALAIRLANQGPGLIVDNRIRSLPNTGGPVVSWSSLFGSDVISVGNTFTVASAVSANGRLVTLDDRTVSRDAIAALEPALPAAQPPGHRRVYEVPAGSDAATIQRAIDTAVREGGVRPIVHLPFGQYRIDRTLTVPPSDVQLVGDGMHTELRWSGTGRGPMLVLESPTRVTLRELQLHGATVADGVVAAGLDRAGSRVYTEGLQLRAGTVSNLFVDRVARATMQHVDLGHANTSRGTSVRIAGGGGADGAGAGRTIIYSGASSGNRSSYDVSGGATLVARDIWYEGPAVAGFARVRDRGNFTLQGSRVATPSGWTPPAFAIDADAGRVALLTTLVDDRMEVMGKGGRADIFAAANLREEVPMPLFTNSSTSPARVLILHQRQRTTRGALIPRNSEPVPDVGTMDAAFVRAMLRDTRTVPPVSALDPVPAGATDLRLYRVWITDGLNDLILRGPQD